MRTEAGFEKAYHSPVRVLSQQDDWEYRATELLAQFISVLGDA
jgi:hypothetical protein